MPAVREPARTHLGMWLERQLGRRRSNVYARAAGRIPGHAQRRRPSRCVRTPCSACFRTSSGSLPATSTSARARGLADFDDLLFWARDLLRDSQPARDYFRRRFRAVLIDEFQDTDPVQAELALLLTSDEEPGEDWRDADARRPGG